MQMSHTCEHLYTVYKLYQEYSTLPYGGGFFFFLNAVELALSSRVEFEGHIGDVCACVCHHAQQYSPTLGFSSR